MKKKWCLSLKVFKLHGWLHLEVNFSCACLGAQMCMCASRAGADMEVPMAFGSVSLDFTRKDTLWKCGLY